MAPMVMGFQRLIVVVIEAPIEFRVAKVFVQSTKLIFHLAQVPPNLVQTFPSLGPVGALLQPTISTTQHGIKPPRARPRRARRCPRCSPRGLRVCRGGGRGRRWRCSSPAPHRRGRARPEPSAANPARGVARPP